MSVPTVHEPPEHPRAADQGPQQRPLGARIRRWFAKASVLGIGISILVHLVGVLITALIVTSTGIGLGVDRGDDSIEFAVISQVELNEILDAAPNTSSPQTSDLLAETTDTPSELLDEPISTDFSLTADIDSDLSVLGGDAGLDSGFGVGDAGGGASFFGAEASGSRFAYIVDTSGSMAENNKIDVLIRELTRSLDGLGRESTFFVVRYSTESEPIGNRRSWTDADARGKAWAKKQVGRLQALGGTRPAQAFQTCLSIRPRPDAIFFMTDGEFGEAETTRILGLLSEYAVPVHGITFVDAGAAAVMQRIAIESGGTYTHVRGTP